MNKLRILLIISMLALTSCSGIVQKQACKICNAKTICHEKAPLDLGLPTPLTLDYISGRMIISEVPTIEFTLDEYRNLITNNKQIENYIDECTTIIKSIEEYYYTPIK